VRRSRAARSFGVASPIGRRRPFDQGSHRAATHRAVDGGFVRAEFLEPTPLLAKRCGQASVAGTGLGVGMKTQDCRTGRANRTVVARAQIRRAMKFASVIRRVAIGIAVLAFAAGDAAAQAPAPAAPPLTLLAAAADAGAAVFDVGGAQRKLVVGDALPGAPWTLSAVRDARVVLDAQRRLNGRRLQMQLRVGERVDSAALAKLEAAQQPQPTTEVTVRTEPRSGARKPAKPGKP
jgi:hypothetical protein